jgi:hypothetical protein
MTIAESESKSDVQYFIFSDRKQHGQQGARADKKNKKLLWSLD